jgi:hypothetical protein
MDFTAPEEVLPITGVIIVLVLEGSFPDCF